MPLLTKLFIAGFGVLLWYLTRTDDSGLSHFGFWLATMGLATFILTAIPLFPAGGYQLLAVLPMSHNCARRHWAPSKLWSPGNAYRKAEA